MRPVDALPKRIQDDLKAEAITIARANGFADADIERALKDYPRQADPLVTSGVRAPTSALLFSIIDAVNRPSFVVRGDDFDASEHPTWAETAERARALADREIAKECAFAVDILGDVVTGLSQLVTRLKREEERGNRTRINLEPTPVFSSSHPNTSPRVSDRVWLRWSMKGDTRCSRDWVLFAATLLAEQATGDRLDIGRCRLHLESQVCEHFFRIERKGPGKPRREYCGTEHRRLQHKYDNYQRVRRARAKRRAAIGKARKLK